MFSFEGIHQEGLLKAMHEKRVKLEDRWVRGEFEGSEEDFYAALENDELILNMVFKDRKPITQTLHRRFKHSQGVAEIANSPGKRISSFVDELEDL